MRTTEGKTELCYHCMARVCPVRIAETVKYVFVCKECDSLYARWLTWTQDEEGARSAAAHFEIPEGYRRVIVLRWRKEIRSSHDTEPQFLLFDGKRRES